MCAHLRRISRLVRSEAIKYEERANERKMSGRLVAFIGLNGSYIAINMLSDGMSALCMVNFHDCNGQSFGESGVHINIVCRATPNEEIRSVGTDSILVFLFFAWSVVGSSGSDRSMAINHSLRHGQCERDTFVCMEIGHGKMVRLQHASGRRTKALMRSSNCMQLN